MPLSFIPPKANAQSLGGYASGLAPAIAALPQCANVLGSGISNLFSGVSGLLGNNSNTSTVGPMYGPPSPNLNQTASASASQFDSVNVNISGTQEGQAILDTNARTQAIQQSTNSLNVNSTCIQSIGRLIIKMLLQKLTVSTINWINSGFDGGPAFVQDPGKFFNDIAKNEVLQMGVEINDPALFPFGKAWLQNTAAAFNSKFQDNAKYSLDKLIQDTTPQYSAETFQQDFSQGGWNAWTAMTESPANNPLGFKLLADNELQKRLAGTTQSTAQNVRDALQAANGFIGDLRCVDASGNNTNITQQQKKDALTAGKQDPCIVAGGSWKYVTPGSLIAAKATQVIGYDNNAYLNVTDLNDAVAAITDALLSQFSSNIMTNGFANVGNQGADGTLVLDTSAINNSNNTSQAQQDFSPTDLSSSWLSINPNFNIRTDLTQALIDEQRTYSDKLQEQNKELMSTTDGQKYKIDTNKNSPTYGQSNAYGLMPAIYQLDYCIPGPHPGWEQDSQKTLSAVTSLIVPETEESLKDRNSATITGAAQSIAPLAGAVIGASIGSAVPVVGTIIGAAAGALVSVLVGLFSSSGDVKKVASYYAYQIESLTGMIPDYNNDNDSRYGNLTSDQPVVQGLNEILNRYINIMDKTYFSTPQLLPPVATEASTDFNQLAGYAQMIKNNQTTISTLQTTINSLEDIKSKIDALNQTYPTGGQDYENALQPYISQFGLLSSSMVNGNDIANADSLLKQIIQEKDYIYKNLLKGPDGCEAFLENPANIVKFPGSGGEVYGTDWNKYDILSVERMTYPFPILYDYNDLKQGSNIPDPWNSGYINQMPKEDYFINPNSDGLSAYNQFTGTPDANFTFTAPSPGFLNFVLFSAGSNGGDNSNSLRGSERLRFDDIFGIPASGSQFVSVNDVFEHVIGIY
jgi:hypothetical protein